MLRSPPGGLSATTRLIFAQTDFFQLKSILQGRYAPMFNGGDAAEILAARYPKSSSRTARQSTPPTAPGHL